MKTKLFDTMLEVVSEVCEVSAQDIISMKKDEEVSDARIILVWLCSRGGIRPKEIAKFLHRKNPNFVSECKTKYTVRDAEYVCFRSLVRKAARLLPHRIKQMEDAEEAKDMQLYVSSCSPTDSQSTTSNT